MVLNLTRIGLALMIHTKKGNQFTFLESLARLAYNKGTALFRGNDPLRRSAAETFSLIINPSAQARKTCSTWVWDGRKAVFFARGEHINQQQSVRHSLQPTQRKRGPCFIEPQTKACFLFILFFCAKLQDELNCEVSCSIVRPWAKTV